MCQVIHSSVSEYSKQYEAELSRFNYVTPTSYLELLGTFNKLIGIKKVELQTSRTRTKVGLDKVGVNLTHALRCSDVVLNIKQVLHVTLFFFQLLNTADDVAKLQEELEVMQPQLEEAVKESELTMKQIAVDSVCIQ